MPNAMLRIESRVQDQLQALRDLLPKAHLAAPSLSKWSVGEHIEHLTQACAATGMGMERALQEGPKPVPGKPKLAAYVLLTFGFIPRGKGKAPSHVIPQGVDGDALRQALDRESQRLTDLKPRLGELQESGWRLKHPIFGPLSPFQWLRFTEIHIQHHRKVIADIEKAAQ